MSEARLTPKQALSDLLKAITEMHVYDDLEGGAEGRGPVVRGFEALGRPLPASLRACLEFDRPLEDEE